MLSGAQAHCFGTSRAPHEIEERVLQEKPRMLPDTGPGARAAGSELVLQLKPPGKEEPAA